VEIGKTNHKKASANTKNYEKTTERERNSTVIMTITMVFSGV